MVRALEQGLDTYFQHVIRSIKVRNLRTAPQSNVQLEKFRKKWQYASIDTILSLIIIELNIAMKLETNKLSYSNL
jgi:hypothetical protein